PPIARLVGRRSQAHWSHPTAARKTGRTMTNQNAKKPGIHLVVPRLSDPRVMVAVAQTLWVVLGATTYYFNRDPFRLGVTVGTACGLDMLIAFIGRREILVPLSA